jgi:hypothetical protein
MFVLTAFALAGTLSGCAPGKGPFLIAQVCLKNTQDLEAFTREMQLIAQSDRARFIDRSADTQKEFDALGHPREGARTTPVVNMGIERGNGIGLMVGNLGLPGYEVGRIGLRGWSLASCKSTGTLNLCRIHKNRARFRCKAVISSMKGKGNRGHAVT